MCILVQTSQFLLPIGLHPAKLLMLFMDIWYIAIGKMPRSAPSLDSIRFSLPGSAYVPHICYRVDNNVLRWILFFQERTLIHSQVKSCCRLFRNTVLDRVYSGWFRSRDCFPTQVSRLGRFACSLCVQTVCLLGLGSDCYFWSNGFMYASSCVCLDLF